MKHSVPHDLGQEKARKVAESALGSYAKKFAKYDASVTWVNPDQATLSFKVKGISLKGKVAVREASIDMELDVPFLLRPFQGMAVSVVDGEIKKWIEKAKAGEV